jgi:hypothetical protein
MRADMREPILEPATAYYRLPDGQEGLAMGLRLQKLYGELAADVGAFVSSICLDTTGHRQLRRLAAQIERDQHQSWVLHTKWLLTYNREWLGRTAAQRRQVEIALAAAGVRVAVLVERDYVLDLTGAPAVDAGTKEVAA